MTHSEILHLLPYSEPFRFVDEIVSIDEDRVKGIYTFKEDEFFYKGHFKDNPITPGVILTECMAQIGLVCLGIFLLKDEVNENLKIGMSNANIDFYLPVMPGDMVSVTSQKEFMRFQKLKCAVAMHNKEGKLICKGYISGMFKLKDE